MKERITEVYAAIQPGQEVQDRIWHRMEAQGAAPKRKGALRRTLILAAVLVALACGGFAAWQGWRLPQPRTYEPDPEMGIYQVQTEAVYTQEQLPQGSQQPQGGQLEDGDFLNQAVAVLEAVGLEDVDKSRMRLVRQENLAYGRQEVQVFFENDALRTSVKLDASFGHLLSISSIDWLEESPVTDRDPALLAREYYEKLPVRQDYVQMDGAEVYDEQYWSYSFCREVQPGLYSCYEMVRISVNPVSGRLVGCNVFRFPLLDDHGHNDTPLSREEAIAAARQVEKVNLTEYELESAEVAVVLPNWFFTEYMDGNLQYADVSRIGWVIRYTKPASQWGEQVELWIDYYTGQLLGGDMV